MSSTMVTQVFPGEHFEPFPAAICYAIFSCIVTILNIPPLYWHGKHRNFAPAFLISLIIATTSFDFISAIIWNNDDVASWFSGVGYCDINVKITIAASTGLPAATLCILKKLADVMDTSSMVVASTRGQQRRVLIFEIIFCVGVSCFSMIMHFVVQPLRFCVVGISGCMLVVSPTLPTLFLLLLPPILLTVIDAYYAVLIIIRLRKYSTRFDSLLSASGTTKSRFLRLFLLSLCFVFVLFPLQCWLLFYKWPRQLKPFNWSQIHNSQFWNQIVLQPSYGYIYPQRWIEPCLGLLVFLFFGLGREAKEMYKSWAKAIWLDRVFGCLARTKPSNGGSSQSSLISRAGGLLSSSRNADKSTICKSTVTTMTSIAASELDVYKSERGSTVSSQGSHGAMIKGGTFVEVESGRFMGESKTSGKKTAWSTWLGKSVHPATPGSGK